MGKLNNFFSEAASFVWGLPLLILLIGGGTYLLIYSRFLPFKYFGHAINVLRGKYDNPDDPGEISHFQALMTALSSTIGMGNIAGVAVAIAIGGPGAVFWMWVSAIVGMSTKFFTCTLAILYRGKDDAGELQGGPMYFIMEGLGKAWKPLAILFSVAGLVGALPIFNVN
ncbi:MAG: alanine:cation symporter family protein, partial [Leeuwenhoekiella sp.]|nr:alanine:cation symporter family protein [Leeuwenhoekiella sp.]